MRAATYSRYGGADVLTLSDAAAPVAAPGEVLLRVRAAALNPKDAFIRKGYFRALSGSRFPKTYGMDFAGEVVSGGGFSVGERVYGSLNHWAARRGSCAELLAVPSAHCGRMPTNLGFEEAAALPLAGQTALQALRDLARVRPGDRVAISGASGGVGVFAIQLARALGAHVTTLSSAANRALCLGLGAQVALDYEKDAIGAQAPFQAIFDVFGSLSFDGVRAVLARPGAFISTVPSRRIFVDTARTALGAQRARLVFFRSTTAQLDTLTAWVEQGLLKPVIDGVFPLAEIVAAARRQETKRARGKIVIRIS
jgi:NADPH:quinone reductase-like Zn-dependent oxidoreductase